MKPGTKVQVVKDVGQWGATSAKPHVGLVGKIAKPGVYPYSKPPEGKTAVIFKSTDLGYEPWDDDHKYVTLYVPTDCLKAKTK
jgi:hypothetical protein